MHGIDRIGRALKIATATADLAPAPGGEALAEIANILAQAQILIVSLRGQIGGAA
jgi:hypothetical protein